MVLAANVLLFALMRRKGAGHQLLVADWKEGRAFISIGLLAAIAWLVALAIKGTQLNAALWSLCIIATIACFGYINETRHYLLLVAFWFAYALPWAVTGSPAPSSTPT